MSEYSKWAQAARERARLENEGRAVKPRIRKQRGGGLMVWYCFGGHGLFDGWGPTPETAYQCWLNQEIPF